MDRPSKVTAAARGLRAACAANKAGMDADVPGWASTARSPHVSSRSCSASSSWSIEDKRRAGSVVMTTSSRRSRSIRVAIRAASKTSVSYSTCRRSSSPGWACTVSG